MTINQGHLPFDKFIGNEIKTLSFLFNNPFIAGPFPNLAEKARLAFFDFNQKPKKILGGLNFIFEANFDIEIEKKLRRVIIESQVKVGFSEVNYALTVCENCIKPFSLMRKFHFDYAIPNKLESPKPIYHFQLGGKQTPALSELDIVVDEFQPWLSSPRINYIPTNLALFLDSIFIEFSNAVTVGITDRREWRDFIKTNEELVLVPYYENISEFSTNYHKADNLIRDFYYGKV